MKNVLFLCIANSVRSQMAEGLAKAIFGSSARVESAGSNPTRVSPLAVRAMDEIGIDLKSHHSKSIDDLDPDFLAALNYVITLCDEEVCPAILSKASKLHWPHPDPAAVAGTDEDKLRSFRVVRDLLRLRLETFKKEKLGGPRERS